MTPSPHNRKESVAFGIDIGGTRIRVGWVHPLPPGSKAPKVDHLAGYEATGDFVLDMRQIAKAIGEYRGQPERVGLAFAGPVSPAGEIIDAPNLRGWVGRKPLEDLAKRIRSERAVYHLSNDAVAQATAEGLWGEHAGQTFLYISWGTGLGGAFVAGQEGGIPVVEGVEPGHVPMHDITPFVCGCGKVNCLETFVGGNGIRTRYKRPAEEIDEGTWHEVCEDFAKGLAAILPLRPTELVVFGGGISYRQSERLAAIAEMLPEYLSPTVPVPRLALGSHGDNAGVIGSLYGSITHRN